jgi:hypothetical protein
MASTGSSPQRSAPQQAAAERYFPVPVRAAVPPGGFGNQLNEMCAWLAQHAGNGGYFTGAQAGPGLQDAALFACGLIIGREPPASAMPRW